MLDVVGKCDNLISWDEVERNFGNNSRDINIFDELPCPIILLNEHREIYKLNKNASMVFDNINLNNELKSVLEKFNYNKDSSDEKCFEAEMLTKCGIRYFEFKVKSIFNIENLFIGSILFLSDFTKYKLLEDKLRKEKSDAENNNLSKNKFLESVSHEIRTSINGIIGMSDLTLMTDLTLEQKENLNLVKSSGIKLLNTVNSILEFSNIQLERIIIDKVEFNFKEFINEIIRVASLKALENKLEFRAKVDDSIPEILIGDPIKIKQILDNIIDNAMNFTKHGTISLIIEREGDIDKKTHLRLYIKDTGIGIDKKDISKLFKGFNKIDNKNYIKRTSGTGLGLSICKGLVEIMEGKIEIKSKKEVGTSVSFDIFLEKQQKHSSVDITERKDRNTSTLKVNKRLNILIVEDDKASQMVMYNLFKKYGHICDIANNGEEAIKIVENKQYDLILMDIQMPIMDGVQATKLIRKFEESKNKHTPIIALTAYALKGDREKILGAGMDDYISKPFNVEELLKTVYGAIKNIDIGENKTNTINNIDGGPLFLYLL